MSLEQALSENTKALLALTAALAAAGLPAAAAAVAPTPPAPAPASRKKKEETPQQAAEAAAAAGKFGPPNEGDEPGTMYFLNTKHNSVYRQFPGDPHVTIAEAKQISGADFLAHQVAQSAAKPAPAPSPTPTDASSPTDASVDLFAAETPKVDRQTMVAKLMEVVKAKGQTAIVPLLQKVGAKNVPAIAEEHIQTVHDAAAALLS